MRGKWPMGEGGLKIALVRHGQSTGNATRQVTGKPNDPLTATGKNQVIQLRKIFFRMPVHWDKYFVSPLTRAVQTAEILFPGTNFEISPELAETDAGSVKDWAQDRFEKEYPDFFNRFSPDRPYPDGESHRDLYDRCVAWFQGVIRNANYRNVLMIAHGGSINAILHYILEIPMDLFPKFALANASVTLVHLQKRLGSWCPTVACAGIFAVGDVAFN